jgi:hypothetical protein
MITMTGEVSGEESSKSFVDSDNNVDGKPDERRVMAKAIDELAAATGSSPEDIAQAFLSVRGRCESNEAALELLRDVARRNPRGPKAPRNGIVVRGGEGPRLPRAEKVLDGTPDPEIGRMVEEGRTRYHLDTLADLEAESHAPPEQEAPVRMVGCTSPAGAILMALACISSYKPTAEDERRREEASQEARRRARQQAQRLVDMPAQVVHHADGCRGAACRSLDACLCSCRRCRQACTSRKSA